MDEGTPRFRYDARLASEIELRWQDRWEREGTFEAPDRDVGQPKFYLLDFFPYPSGIGLLYDIGVASTPEPFGRLFNQGYILADAFTDARGQYVPAAEVTRDTDGWTYRGQPVTRRAGKMSKSLKNGVSPDDIYTSYGADTLRLYEMVMGPLDGDRPWRTDDIVGMHRFLQRLWRLIVDEATGETLLPLRDEPPLDAATTRLLHQTIIAVRGDFAALRFNTAIARIIELTAHAARLAEVPRALAEPLVLMPGEPGRRQSPLAGTHW